MNIFEIRCDDVFIINDVEYRVFSVNDHEINLHNDKGELISIKVNSEDSPKLSKEEIFNTIRSYEDDCMDEFLSRLYNLGCADGSNGNENDYLEACRNAIDEVVVC